MPGMVHSAPPEWNYMIAQLRGFRARVEFRLFDVISPEFCFRMKLCSSSPTLCILKSCMVRGRQVLTDLQNAARFKGGSPGYDQVLAAGCWSPTPSLNSGLSASAASASA
jgi:hypothetical protein